MTAPPTRQRGACGRCGRVTVTAAEWIRARGPVRDAWRALGFRRYAGHGLCSACHSVLRNAGELEQYIATKGALPGRCSRCGRSDFIRGSLCADCTLVTGDLGEQERWAS